jgi:anti-anti-sigma factor
MSNKLLRGLPFTISRVPPGRVATDHSGMLLRTHNQADTTIVEVRGAVDACNAALLSDYADDLASVARPLILDFSDVEFFGVDGLRTLVEITEKSQQTGMRWALVTNAAVDRLLRITDSSGRLPIAPSLGEALQQLTSSPHPAWPPPQRLTRREFTRC